MDQSEEQSESEEQLMSLDEVKATFVYKILMQYPSPKDITCDISNSKWPTVRERRPRRARLS